jgi:hypothetical protein
MDPDQEEGEELPEDQAEEDSMLITAVSDVVALLATALGAHFTEPFQRFFPLITKYFVSGWWWFCWCLSVWLTCCACFILFVVGERPIH